MKISAAFPPVPETPDHIALAEELGYETAWVYDTPALQLDVWMTLALAGVRTDRIRLGTGVLIPSLRHPMTTAAAIATLVGLVGPERVIIGAGTGFTGRRAMGQKPLRWADFPGMVADIQALLRGEIVEVDGRAARMLHWPGQAIERPIEVPWIVAVNGPRGLAAAAEMGCGVFTSRPRPDADYAGIDDVILLGFGTIMDDDETIESPRVLDTAGPGVSVAYHAFLEQRDARLETLPNADRFADITDDMDPATLHLSLHDFRGVPGPFRDDGHNRLNIWHIAHAGRVGPIRRRSAALFEDDGDQEPVTFVCLNRAGGKQKGQGYAQGQRDQRSGPEEPRSEKRSQHA